MDQEAKADSILQNVDYYLWKVEKNPTHLFLGVEHDDMR